MAYNSVALQQMRGQKLLDALAMAHGTFRQREAYQTAVNDQYKRLASLREDKDIWTINYAMKHPAKWATIASVVLSILIVLLYFKADDGDMLIPCLVVAFSFFGVGTTFSAQMHYVGKHLKGIIKNMNVLAGISVLIPILLIFVIVRFAGFGWLIVLYGLVGIYVALCWADAKLVHKEEHNQKKKQHFRKQDEEMALELSWRLKRLQDFCASETMQFAEALVPQEFQSSQELGALMLIMKKYAVYDLHSAIRDYYQEKHMEQMEAEAAAARRAQEQALQEQRAQTEILEWQRRDNHWHNKEMEYQQQRQNETLNDMKREQKEYHDRIKHYMDGYRY